MGKRRILSLLLAVLTLCLTVLPAAAADSVTAATMQLAKTEGTVNVTNSSGRSLTRRDNMNLYNGYHVETKAKSYAWINLDSSKLVKLDAVSEAEVRKSGKSLEMLLSSGSFFFNVSSPLKEGETLNVRTATMVVGIRGTSGWFKAVDRWSTEIYVLEGTVQCSVSDPVTGQAKEATIQSGEMAVATAYPQDWAGDKCDIVQEKFEPGDIDGFVLEELAQDPELCADILEKSGLDVMSAVEATQERLEQDQQQMQDALDRIENQQVEQDSGTSTGPVWGQEDPAPSPPPPPPDTSAGDDDDSGGGVPDDPTVPDQPSDAPRMLENWKTAQDVQDALIQAQKNGVALFLLLNSDKSNSTLSIDIPMIIPGGAALSITGGIDVVIKADFSLTVESGGSILVDQGITNNGTLTNEADGLITASLSGSGTIENSGKIVRDISVSDGGTFNMEIGTVTGDISVSDGGTFNLKGGTVTGDISVSDGGTFNMEDGAVTGDISVSDGGIFSRTGGTVKGKPLADGPSEPAGDGKDPDADTSADNEPPPIVESEADEGEKP